MSYIITKTDGGLLSTPNMINGVLLDGTTDTSTGLTLIGQNYINYGQVQNDNFIKLLENFADSLPPNQTINATVLLQGQLWYDTVNQKLMVYDNQEFIPVSQRSVGASAPSITYVGDQWWDTTNNQLKAWTGSAWLLIGPAYSSVNGKGGVFVETVTDTNNVTHTVLNNYINGNLVSVTSYDPTFSTTESLYSSYFATIEPGINIASTMFFNGTATNANTINGFTSSQFVRGAVDNTLNGNLYLNQTLSLNNANISYSGGALVVNNFNNNSNIEFYVHGTNGNVNALHIDGSTGLVSVGGNAVTDSGVTTKSYVDTSVNNAVATLSAMNSTTAYNLDAINTELTGCVAVLTSGVYANIGIFQSQVNANLVSTTNTLVSNIASMNANITGANVVIGEIISVLPSLAPVADPSFVGNAQAPDVSGIVSYAQSLGPNSNPYVISFSASVNVTGGQTIQLINQGNLYTYGTCTVLQANGNTNIAVVSSPITGSFPTSATSYYGSGPASANNIFIEVNGSQPYGYGVYFTRAIYVGPSLLADNILIGDNSNSVATTRYVDVTANILNYDYQNQITNLNNSLTNSSNSGLALKANLAGGAAFTGTITMPTPAANSNDTTAATTLYVTRAITTAQTTLYSTSGGPGTGPKITVGTNTPSGGNDGDIWLQVGS
jgi:hypothetical protein